MLTEKKNTSTITQTHILPKLNSTKRYNPAAVPAFHLSLI